MRVPNCLRSWTYFSAAFNAPRAMPSIWAPMPILPMLRVSMATLYPLPTSPSKFAPGTRQFSNSTSVVLDARIPSLSSFLPTLSPSNSRSTMNAVIPL